RREPTGADTSGAQRPAVQTCVREHPQSGRSPALTDGRMPRAVKSRAVHDRSMPEILCTQCGEVGVDNAGRCAHCGSTEVLPADSPLARKFIDARNARQSKNGDLAKRSEATGKVFGRAFGKLIKK